MATLARYRGTQQLPGVRRPQVIADTAVGEATAALGQQIQKSAAQIGELVQLAQERQTKIDLMESRRGTLRLRANLNDLLLKEKEKMAPGGVGFYKRIGPEIDKSFKAFVAAQPPGVRRSAETEAVPIVEAVRQQALETEQQAGWSHARDGLVELQDEAYKVVRLNPSTYDEILQKGIQDIHDSHLPRGERAKWEKTYRNNLAKVLAGTLPATERVKLFGTERSMDAYFARIRSVESSGNDSAKNPNSTATGRYQFTAETWDRLRSSYPELGLTAEGRTDPEQQEKAIRAFTLENAAILQSNKIGRTHANLYAAHFLGARGAVNVLTADDDTELSSLVSPSVIKANAFLRGMTVGDFKAWAESKVGSGAVSEVPERCRGMLDDLTYGDQVQLYDQAQREIAISSSKRQEELETAIAEDPEQPGLREAIVNDALLDDGQKAAATKALDTAQKNKAGERTARGWFNQRGIGDPQNKDDQKNADLIYREMVATGMAPDIAAKTVIARKGLIPPTFLHAMHNGLQSDNWEQVLAAHRTAVVLIDLDELAVIGSEYGGQLKEAKAMWQYYTDKVRYSPEETARRLAADNNSEFVQQREVLLQDESVKDKLKEIDASHIEKIFNEGPWYRRPELRMPSLAVYEFKKLFMDAIVEKKGDVEAAEVLALTRFKETWHVSRLSKAGEDFITNNSPENFCPKIGEGDGYDYLEKEAEEILSQEGVKYQKFAIEINEFTLEDWRFAQEDENGFGPRMTITYKDDTGWHSLQNPFQGDIRKAKAKHKLAGRLEAHAKYRADAEGILSAQRRYEMKHRGRIKKTQNAAKDIPKSGDEAETVGERVNWAWDVAWDTQSHGPDNVSNPSNTPRNKPTGNRKRNR